MVRYFSDIEFRYCDPPCSLGDMDSHFMKLLDNEFGQEGLVKKVNQNEQNIADLVKFKQKIIAWATGAGLGSSALVNAIAEMIK